MSGQEARWRYGKDRFGGLIPFLWSQFKGSFQEQRSGVEGNEDRGGNIKMEERPETGGLEIRNCALNVSEHFGVG